MHQLAHDCHRARAVRSRLYCSRQGQSDGAVVPSSVTAAAQLLHHHSLLSLHFVPRLHEAMNFVAQLIPFLAQALTSVGCLLHLVIEIPSRLLCLQLVGTVSREPCALYSFQRLPPTLLYCTTLLPPFLLLPLLPFRLPPSMFFFTPAMFFTLATVHLRLVRFASLQLSTRFLSLVLRELIQIGRAHV